VGQYSLRVDNISLQIALAASSDLEGFKILVGYVFGKDFDTIKKKSLAKFENFEEKPQLWELMGNLELLENPFLFLIYLTLF
jgi:hypothetical protein